MQRFPGVLAAAMLVLPSAASAQAPPPDPMTLNAAIEYALKHSPDVAGAVAGVRSAEGAATAAKSSYMPTLQASIAESRIQDEPAGFQRSSTTVSASQLIYDLGRTSNNVASAEASLRAAKYDRENRRLLVSQSVTAAYYALLQSEGLAAVCQDTLESRKAERDAAQARLDNGTVARFDLLQAETALAQSRQALAAATGSVRNARSALNATMGRPAGEPLSTVEPDIMEAPTQTESEQVQWALEHRPDVLAAREQVESARRSLSSAKVGNAPFLAATGSVDGRSHDFPASTLKWSAGLSLSWTAFDGFLNAGRVKSAQASVQSAEAALRMVELEASRQVTDSVTALETAMEQVRLGEATFRQASEARDMAVGRYKAGAGTQLEVTDAESNLHAARVDLLNARYELARAKRDAWTILGVASPSAAPGGLKREDDGSKGSR